MNDKITFIINPVVGRFYCVNICNEIVAPVNTNTFCLTLHNILCYTKNSVCVSVREPTRPKLALIFLPMMFKTLQLLPGLVVYLPVSIMQLVPTLAEPGADMDSRGSEFSGYQITSGQTSTDPFDDNDIL